MLESGHFYAEPSYRRFYDVLKATIKFLGLKRFFFEYFAAIFRIDHRRIDHLATGGSLINTMGGPFRHHFGHWMGEELPSYKGLVYLREFQGLDFPVILKSEVSDYELEALAMLGHDGDIVKKDPLRTLKVNSLALTSNRNVHSQGMEFDPRARVWVKSALRSYRTNLRRSRTLDHGPRRIFLHRQHSKDRRLENYNQVLALTSDFDFVGFDPSEMSFSEVFNLVGSAEVLVGVYGAGFIHMLSMPDLKHTIEIAPPAPESRPIWFEFSCELGVTYWSVQSERSKDQRSHGPGSGVNDLSWWVDPTKLETIMKTCTSQIS